MLSMLLRKSVSQSNSYCCI